MFPNQNTQPPGYEFLGHNGQVKKQRSAVTIILLAFFILLSLCLMLFGFWAFAGRQDYKNNVDKKIAVAIDAAKQQVSADKEKEFAERDKNPNKEYKGPGTFGSVDILYPRTWSAFVTEDAKAPQPVNGYFHPEFVPGIQSGTAFALRVQVTNQSYDQELKQFEAKAKSGKVTVAPYKAPKVPEALGARVEGEINNNQKGIIVLFPLRDKTLKISTESEQFRADLDTIILANLTFIP